MNNIDLLIELTVEEKKNWRKSIKKIRCEIVKKPSYYTNKIFNDMYDELVKLTSSEVISTLRDNTWNLYVEDEVHFNEEIMKELLSNYDYPKNTLENIICDTSILEGTHDKEMLYKELTSVFGSYAGKIMPYIYELSLSTTNSRRSRAGTTFELIIEKLMILNNINFTSQSQLGKDFFEKNGIGKMVDMIVPGESAYSDKRDKCAILTMKTSLRERWQEVVEEMQRTNIPHIFLLTLDSKISENMLKSMKQYNITVVTYESIERKYSEHSNIISFERFTDVELKHIISWWEK